MAQGRWYYNEKHEFVPVPEKSRESKVSFPMWVKPPSPCKTRTFSVVLPGNLRHGQSKGGYHGAVRIQASFPNKPLVKLHRIGLPGFYNGWLDAQTVETKVYP